jgi:threonylcarbamoyladenosine tRNA methylthiotransferase MtaB
MSAPRLLTFGCRLNTYEAAVMRDLAAAAGAGEETIIVNTCAVTAEAERQARQAIRRAARDAPGARIIVTGCAAQIAPAAWGALPGVARVVGNADKLTPAAWTDTAPRPVSDVMAARGAAAHPVTDFVGRARAFVQVQQGCDHRCTFCVIPFGRGPSGSVPAEAVSTRLRALVAAGFAEAVLTGVDIASYGTDLPGRPTLGRMLRQVLAEVPDLPRLRLSSLDPAGIDDDLWHLIAEEPRLLPHLHLSVQHGHDLILKRMKRRHLRADVLAIARRARTLRPDMALGADLIAGFPTETEAHVQATLDLIAEAGLSFLHVFPFSARPGVPAARMPQLPMELRRERAARLRAAGEAEAARLFASRLGMAEEVLMETPTRGHTAQFAPLRLRAGEARRGSLLRVVPDAFDRDGLSADIAAREAA